VGWYSFPIALSLKRFEMFFGSTKVSLKLCFFFFGRGGFPLKEQRVYAPLPSVPRTAVVWVAYAPQWRRVFEAASVDKGTNDARPGFWDFF